MLTSTLSMMKTVASQAGIFKLRISIIQKSSSLQIQIQVRQLMRRKSSRALHLASTLVASSQTVRLGRTVESRSPRMADNTTFFTVNVHFMS